MPSTQLWGDGCIEKRKCSVIWRQATCVNICRTKVKAAPGSYHNIRAICWKYAFPHYRTNPRGVRCPSSSGKTIIIASTEGNVSIPERDEKVGLNVYHKKS